MTPPSSALPIPPLTDEQRATLFTSDFYQALSLHIARSSRDSIILIVPPGPASGSKLGLLCAAVDSERFPDKEALAKFFETMAKQIRDGDYMPASAKDATTVPWQAPINT